MVAEQRQNADAEHGRNKKQEQDVEFGVSVRQFVLMEETGEDQREIRGKFSLFSQLFMERGGTRQRRDAQDTLW